VNEEKVREVISYCYKKAHESLSFYPGLWSPREMYEALRHIEKKIEELTDEDLGES
jgi:hypothetical protein